MTLQSPLVGYLQLLLRFERQKSAETMRLSQLAFVQCHKTRHSPDNGHDMRYSVQF